MTQQHNTLVYGPLPLYTGEIRLVFLKHAAWDAEIEIELKVVHLTNCPPYDALSYTWGDQIDGYAVIVNEEPSFPVTKNLWLALRRLRYIDEIRILWIDAICIDQGKVQERNVQVGRIYDIYESATRVIVWLGEPSGAAVTSTIETQGSGSKSEPITSPELDPQRTSKCPKNAAYDDMDRIIHNKERVWWDRAWTVQEVLANNNIIVCFGPREFMWTRDNPDHDFVKWVDEYQFEQYQIDTTLDRQRMLMLEQFQWIKDLSRKRRKGDYRFTALADIIMRRSATDPRDKVYSLLGVMNTGTSSLILPDYTLKVWQVFAKATFAVIVGDASFEILRFVNPCSPRLADLPSWVVDLSAAEQKAKIPWTPLGRFQKSKNPNTPRKVSHSVDLKVLHVIGHTLDIVKRTFCLPFPLSDIYEDLAPEELVALLAEALDTTKKGSKIPFYDEPKVFEAMQSLPSPRGEAAQPQQSSKETSIGDELRAALDKWDLLSRRPRDVSHRVVDKKEDWLSDALTAIRWYAEIIAGTAMVFSTKEGFIGIAPANMRPDDVVALLPGAKRPIILRRSATEYKFLGFSYVHGTCTGCAPGEIEDNWFEGRLPEVEFQMI